MDHVVWLLVIFCTGAACPDEIKSIHSSLIECKAAARKELLQAVCISGVIERKQPMEQKP